ncbi:hypothetical protein ACFL5K_02790 [Gemmatimonadota bacterium]
MSITFGSGSMYGKKHIPHSIFWLSAASLIVCGCFSLPFIGGGGSKITEPVEQDFNRINVFVGYDKKDAPIVEMQLMSQEISDKGLIVHTRFFPTDNFKVRNQFRGLRSINYYPIERRFHRLELRYGRKKVKTKVTKNIQVKGIKPFLADFEHTGIHYLLPDTIDLVKLKFQDVRRWDRLPMDTLDTWYVSKEQFLKEVNRQTRRQNLLETYRRRQQQDRTEEFSQYDSLFITTNNTYVYLDKSVDSEILFTMNAGERVDFGVSDGIWVEFNLPDSLADDLSEFLERRRQGLLVKWQQQRERRRTRTGARQQEADVDTTARMTAYALDVMVGSNYRKSIEWEKHNLEQPVDVPLFAQVLKDRVAAEIARQDSIEQARIDSVQAYADSLVLADSLANAPADSSSKADSLALPDSLAKVPADSSSKADSLSEADSSQTGASQAGEIKLGQNYPNPVRLSTAPTDSVAVGDSLTGDSTTAGTSPPDTQADTVSPAPDSLQSADSTVVDSAAGGVRLKQNYPNPF